MLYDRRMRKNNRAMERELSIRDHIEDEYGWSRKAFTLGVLTYALLGPPIGLAVLFLSATIAEAFYDFAGFLYNWRHFHLNIMEIQTIISFISNSYFIGLLPATTAGFIVLRKETVNAKFGFRYAVLIGAVFSILFALLVKILLYNDAPLDEEMLPPLVFSLVPCFIATPVCWLIVRPLRWVGTRRQWSADFPPATGRRSRSQ
jgi:hypothetical protein